jgi:hypothetical protein
MKTVLAGVVGGLVVLVIFLLLRPVLIPQPEPQRAQPVSTVRALTPLPNRAIEAIKTAGTGKGMDTEGTYWNRDEDKEINDLSTRVTELERDNNQGWP